MKQLESLERVWGLSALVVLTAGLQAPGLAGSLTGTASYRERIALPPDAVFEAMLIDTALADAPARELGRVRLQPAGQPPFRFTIPYRDQDLSPAGRFSVRATVRQGERLLFTTDTVTPVLTGGPSQPLRLTMVQVNAAPSDGAPTQATALAAEPRLRLQGMFAYQADAPSIRLCSSGERLPVAMEGDYLRLERAYLRALPGGAAGQPLLVSLEGRISRRPSAEPGAPALPTLVVERFLAVHRGRLCPTVVAP